MTKTHVAATLISIERALLDADTFVLARGEDDRQHIEGGSFINPLSDCPLRRQIGDALIALGAVRVALADMEAPTESHSYCKREGR